MYVNGKSPISCMPPHTTFSRFPALPVLVACTSKYSTCSVALMGRHQSINLKSMILHQLRTLNPYYRRQIHFFLIYVLGYIPRERKRPTHFTARPRTKRHKTCCVNPNRKKRWLKMQERKGLQN